MTYTGVVIFERTDGVPFDTDPMVYTTRPFANYREARDAASCMASESLRNGAMAQDARGWAGSDSMRQAADRIFTYGNATYEFELPNGSTGEFLVRWRVADND